MSLFVRVNTSFYSHIKTIKLRSKLGNDAYWVPPRIWAIAAEQRPDGNLDGINAEELAMLTGYSGDATSMLQALLQAGFLDSDPLRIHNWDQHNGYHVNYADRARSAAKARWEKAKSKNHKPKLDTKTVQGEESTVQGEEKRRASIASSMLQASQASLLPEDPPKLSEGEQAEEIYKLYPLKVGKPDAIVKIRASLRKYGFEVLKEKTQCYNRAVDGTETLIPHPATWFHQERFNDAPETWVRQQNRNRYDENTNRHNQGNGSGRPTPAQLRNSQIIGAESVRAAILAEADNPKPPPWAKPQLPEVPKGAVAA